MNRKIVVALAILLVIGAQAAPVYAQSDGPLPKTEVHIVQRGETLFSIAQRYSLTVEAITHANSISDPRQIYVGQRLFIPGEQADTSVAETVPYVFQAGDTLTSIARRYSTTWQTLAQINALLSPNAIYAGQVIQVPAFNNPASANAEGVTHPLVSGGTAYIVRPDDTLLRVAISYDISPWTLATANHIVNPALIYPGQELIAPGEGPSLLPAPFAYVEVQPLPVAQGTAMIVTVQTTEPVTLTGKLFEQEVRFAEEEGVYYGLVGVHVFAEPGLFELELTAVDSERRSTVINTGLVVEANRFYYERIDVPAGRTSLLDPAAIARDRERLDTARLTFTSERLWEVPFQRPCVGPISAYFGAHRSYNGGPYTSYHSGVDFRAPGGTPVYASAAGTVVLAEPLTLWGNAVVIDHGWGVLTGYAHISKIEVQVGQKVVQGELIARVGNTGLSTGSHLHWETWVGGTSVNGLQWLEESYPWPETKWLAVGG
ncbi:MAG: LysM peptidoglycan-binding domain-containing protein [Chloroflexota bacterium]|nr:LysM peptidoglycan-binding domain-containing protein [Chloroflexota bacterium]